MTEENVGCGDKLAMVRGVLIALAFLIPCTARAELVECSYDLPNAGKMTFISDDGDKWLEAENADHSLEKDHLGWRTKAECHALDNTARNWHLLTKTEGGTVSLIKDITRLECEKMKKGLTIRHASGQSWMVQTGDIQSMECFE